jgi:alpha-beta hydrolase superfamily lysophospholipase
VPMAGSRRGIALLRNAEVTEKIYPGARHEIFNELKRFAPSDDITVHQRGKPQCRRNE